MSSGKDKQAKATGKTKPIRTIDEENLTEDSAHGLILDYSLVDPQSFIPVLNKVAKECHKLHNMGIYADIVSITPSHALKFEAKDGFVHVECFRGESPGNDYENDGTPENPFQHPFTEILPGVDSDESDADEEEITRKKRIGKKWKRKAAEEKEAEPESGESGKQGKKGGLGRKIAIGAVLLFLFGPLLGLLGSLLGGGSDSGNDYRWDEALAEGLASESENVDGVIAEKPASEPEEQFNGIAEKPASEPEDEDEDDSLGGDEADVDEAAQED